MAIGSRGRPLSTPIFSRGRRLQIRPVSKGDTAPPPAGPTDVPPPSNARPYIYPYVFMVQMGKLRPREHSQAQGRPQMQDSASAVSSGVPAQRLLGDTTGWGGGWGCGPQGQGRGRGQPVLPRRALMTHGRPSNAVTRERTRGDMDATTAPHLIPPEMPQYGEDNHIFEMMQNMLEQVLIHQPQDPIPFMIEHLRRNNDNVPKIVILGPPASGKTTIAMWLCKHLNSTLLTKENLLGKEFAPLSMEAKKRYKVYKTIPDEMFIHLIQERVNEEDCIRKGWILDGIPETREQALMLQTQGLAPRHVIVLNAPDTVLIERNLGKRIDPVTGEVYHTTFDWPPEPEVQNRLVEPEGISELETAQKLLDYHRNITRILPTYPKILKTISADQPCVDVFYQALTYVQAGHRCNAPFTPKVLLCGPTGCGKKLQAALLAQKYDLVNVCCGKLLKEAVADKSPFGVVIRPFFEKQMAVPDSIIMKVLDQRLSQQDCIQKGWVLHGFPRDLDQARMLSSVGHNPNRVFFLNVPLDSILERLTLRRTDPVTGERYHLMYKPPPTMEVQARLLQNPKDSEDQVKLRIDLFYQNCEELENFYEKAITLNGDQDPYTVFEYIESGIINPLPERLA